MEYELVGSRAKEVGINTSDLKAYFGVGTEEQAYKRLLSDKPKGEDTVAYLDRQLRDIKLDLRLMSE